MRPPSLQTEVAHDLWTACGGPTARAPHVGSLVYYFPEGHFESVPSSPPSDHLPSIHLSRPFFLCTVLSVRLLADPDSDEVFFLVSLSPSDGPRCATSPRTNPSSAESFSKVLTQSDANNGGGFSVPRCCADSIFPPLDLTADPPVQNLVMRDVHGKAFEFRHIYRGTPRRHLLTTGWARFVNEKKLVAGDTVVFIKNRRDLFIGVRRGPRFVRTHVAPEEVLNSVDSAVNGRPFEVVYYPRVGEGCVEFVVEKERVERAMLAGYWSVGLRVKMAVDSVDSVRTSVYQGTVTEIRAKPEPWTSSPWRALQVTWDDPEAVKLVRQVSPWQVEINQSIPAIHTIAPPYNYTPPLKRARTAPSNDHFTPRTTTTSNDHFTSRTTTAPNDHFTPCNTTTPDDHFTPRTTTTSNDHYTPRTTATSNDHFTPRTAPTLTPCIQGARQSAEYHSSLVYGTPGPSTPLTPPNSNPFFPDLEGSDQTVTELSRSAKIGTLMLFGKLIEFVQSDESSGEGFKETSGDEVFLPGFNEPKTGPVCTRYFTDLVLQSEGV